ncbi:hypothetical protein [Microbacterium sp. APC 3901]|uniref:hypothetical protein n=1 Tax=Microbacterium sp. APC 3901 TaxID=3035192 RepID=UPI0025B298A1|nr:hypothetical protein [Microbacterium sp. APC 3901]MDN3443843.1 hypothetical protein [Microbacterium sp. APC 3901]
MSYRTAAAVSLLAALCVAAITGCTAPTSEAMETPAPARPVADPTPIDTPAPTPTSTAPASRCAVLSQISIPGYSEGDEEPTWYATWNGVVPVDNGETDFARGTVAKTADGRIATYTVAAGDAPSAIRERLCTDVYAAMTYNRLGSLLYPGDVLMLGPGAMEPLATEPFIMEPQRR